MHSAICPYCQTTARSLYRVADLNRRLSDELFAYYRCPKCRLIFLWPQPADLGRYYPAEYYGATHTLADLEPQSNLERYKLALVQQFAQTGRLLEVGPSRGVFLCLAKASGFQVSAIERDPECCRFLSEVAGIETINVTDPAAALTEQQPFDLIVLWQVIEHLGDPWAFVRAAAANLKVGAHLLIATPNPDSLQYRLFGRFWAHLDAPRHLQLIPASLLVEMGSRLNLRQVLLDTKGEGRADRNNIFGWQRSLSNVLHQERTDRITAKIMGYIAHRLGGYEQEHFRGSTYTLVLRKHA